MGPYSCGLKQSHKKQPLYFQFISKCSCARLGTLRESTNSLNCLGSLSFGHCIQQPHDAQPGQMVTAKFVSGHLRNDLLTGDSFLRVEHNEVA